MYEHQKEESDSEKGSVIAEILAEGLEVIHTVLMEDLAEEQALRIEAELIAAFGIRSRGGLITNRVRPNTENISKRVRVNVLEGCYERAQLGLDMLKSALMELARANPQGIPVLMLYQTLEQAIVAAKKMCLDLETVVKITIAPEGGYELFGTGDNVMSV